MSKSYAEKLTDPRWQRKRLEVFYRDKFTCQACGDYTKTLHVHHLIYKTNAAPWDYLDEELQTVCEDCHRGETIEQEQVKFKKKFLELAERIVTKPYTTARSLNVDKLIERFNV